LFSWGEGIDFPSLGDKHFIQVYLMIERECSSRELNVMHVKTSLNSQKCGSTNFIIYSSAEVDCS
jgi:hypothetical protein